MIVFCLLIIVIIPYLKYYSVKIKWDGMDQKR